MEKNFLRLLFIGVLVIVFWVSIWDTTEILVDDFLESYDKKDNRHRVMAFIVLGTVSVGLIYALGAMDVFR